MQIHQYKIRDNVFIDLKYSCIVLTRLKITSNILSCFNFCLIRVNESQNTLDDFLLYLVLTLSSGEGNKQNIFLSVVLMGYILTRFLTHS